MQEAEVIFFRLWQVDQLFRVGSSSPSGPAVLGAKSPSPLNNRSSHNWVTGVLQRFCSLNRGNSLIRDRPSVFRLRAGGLNFLCGCALSRVGRQTEPKLLTPPSTSWINKASENESMIVGGRRRRRERESPAILIEPPNAKYLSSMRDCGRERSEQHVWRRKNLEVIL